MIIEISFFNLTSFSKIYPFEKSIFKLFRSFIEFILYCPLPSYPKVVVLSIPGNKFCSVSIWDKFSIETYCVVLIFNLFIKSFSANLCWIILFIDGLGKTGFDLLISFKVSYGIFSNS